MLPFSSRRHPNTVWTLLIPLLLALTLSAADGSSAPVIVELFTSEGCSSCPPADHLLSVLDEDQPIPGAHILVLSEHVDYWNRLGWTDPYSAAAFSDRQQRYASALRSETYTPQMIVDGRVQFVGNDAQRARQAIEVASRLPKTPIGLQRLEDTLQVQIGALPAKATDAEVVLAIAESNLQSSVDRGENAGRRLRHTAVVRRLTVLGPLKSGAPFSTSAGLRLNPAWKRENLRAVVFIQERKTLRILGAASLRL
jgi:hypothetical protein